MADTDSLDSSEFMLTTVDNPYNPFTQYEEWMEFDATLGYHTPSFLGRVVVLSNELSEADAALAVQVAIEQIVQENVLGLYRKVSRSSFSQTE